MSIDVLAGVYIAVLALEAPAAIIAWRNGSETRTLSVPMVMFAAGIAVPEGFAKLSLLAMSFLTIYGIAIVGRFRRTHREETQYLATHGPSLWPPQRRRQSRNLLVTGALWTLSAIVADAISGHRTVATVLLFPTGSLLIGLSLVRSHAVLTTYFGNRRARWLELIQAIALISAYALVMASELTPDPSGRLQLRILSLAPLAFHFVFVWLPLARTQERLELPDGAQTQLKHPEGR